jgi:asparagine synthase (glutamine-hydrolysing)
VLQRLAQALREAVKDILPEQNIVIAFSGGVDSSLLSVICRDLGKKTTLVTVGFPGSHDISFSRIIASKIGLPQKIVELDYLEFQQDLAHIKQAVNCENTSHIENCIAYYYIARAANKLGIAVVGSANGCDELFCGYDGYRSVFNKGGSAIMEYTESKIENELMLVKEISAVSAEFSVHVRQPFLSSARFVEFAKNLPMDQKIKGADDMIRKHILRQAALALGVPIESALKPKKALQYGSFIHKNYKKSLYLRGQR